MLLMIVAAGELLSPAASVCFYVQRRLVRRLTSIGDAMRRLSSGETDLTVRGRGRQRRNRRDGALATKCSVGRDRYTAARWRRARRASRPRNARAAPRSSG
jgi:hypothetical protein